MRTTRHDPPAAPTPVGGYSQAVELAGAERILYVSGQTPEHPESGVPDGFDAQCRQAWQNLLAPAWLLEIDAIAAR